MEVLVIYKIFVVSQQKKSLEEQAQSVTFPGAQTPQVLTPVSPSLSGGPAT